MKSRTSFSKLTPFRKDLTRFAPVWALYLVGVLLYVMAAGRGGYADVFAFRTMGNMTSAFAIINLIYAGVCAVMLFGDLFNTKLCYSLHSLPQRRESWLLSHLCAGFVFSLVPNALLTLFFMVRCGEYWFLALYWLLAAELEFMFFFGLAVFCVMLTGRRFAMLAVYMVFNFMAMLIYAVVQIIYIPMLQGVYTQFAEFAIFSPVVRLVDRTYFMFHGKQIMVGLDRWGEVDTRTYYVFDGLGNGWIYLAILGVVGLAFLAGGWWLYRKRHLESAGDFLAFSRTKAAASVVITTCVTLMLAVLGKLFMEDGYVIWLALGLVVGHFGGLMLLERRLKVFRKKTFLGLGIMVLVVVLTMACVGMDWLGIESWTPNAKWVESVTVSNYRSDQKYYGPDDLSVTLDQPEQIAEIILAHEDILDRLDEPQEDENLSTHRVCLEYKMKSGRTVMRYYLAPANGENYEIILKYLYTTDSVLGFRDPADVANRVHYLYFENFQVPREFYETLFVALQQDYAGGHVHMNIYSAEMYTMEYNFEDNEGNQHYRSLSFDKRATHLMALMQDPCFMMGFHDLGTFLPKLEAVHLGGEYLVSEMWSGLLEAMLLDAKEGKLHSVKNYTGILICYEWEDSSGNYCIRDFSVEDEDSHTYRWMQDNGFKERDPET